MGRKRCVGLVILFLILLSAPIFAQGTETPIPRAFEILWTFFQSVYVVWGFTFLFLWTFFYAVILGGLSRITAFGEGAGARYGRVVAGSLAALLDIAIMFFTKGEGVEVVLTKTLRPFGVLGPVALGLVIWAIVYSSFRSTAGERNMPFAVGTTGLTLVVVGQSLDSPAWLGWGWLLLIIALFWLLGSLGGGGAIARRVAGVGPEGEAGREGAREGAREGGPEGGPPPEVARVGQADGIITGRVVNETTSLDNGIEPDAPAAELSDPRNRRVESFVAIADMLARVRRHNEHEAIATAQVQGNGTFSIPGVPRYDDLVVFILDAAGTEFNHQGGHLGRPADPPERSRFVDLLANDREDHVIISANRRVIPHAAAHHIRNGIHLINNNNLTAAVGTRIRFHAPGGIAPPFHPREHRLTQLRHAFTMLRPNVGLLGDATRQQVINSMNDLDNLFELTIRYYQRTMPRIPFENREITVVNQQLNDIVQAFERLLA